MKIWTSYFYMVRFFKPWMIPLSTATWDPKWYHNFKGQKEVWKDKNGVWNGLRIEELNPNNCCTLEPECLNCKSQKNPEICSFLKDYSSGLSKVSFRNLIENISDLANKIKALEGFQEEPEIMLLLHEAPDNKCSERKPLQDFFKSNGIEITEWIKI